MTTSPGRLVEMLREVVTAFARDRIPHAVAGGMAVAAHGHPRATRDIDFLIDAVDAGRADSALRLLGFIAEPDDGAGGFVRYQRRPLSEFPELVEWVDLLLARQATGRDLIAQASRKPVRWNGIDLPVVSVEGIVLMKLLSSISDPSRAHDRSDIVALLRANAGAFDHAWVENAAIRFGEEHARAFRQLVDDADAPAKPSRSPGL